MVVTEGIPWIEQAVNLFLREGSKYGWKRVYGITAGGTEPELGKDHSYGKFRPLREISPVGLDSKISVEFYMNVNKTLVVSRFSNRAADKFGATYTGYPEDRKVWFFEREVKIRDIPRIVPEVESEFKKSVEDIKKIIEQEPYYANPAQKVGFST